MFTAIKNAFAKLAERRMLVTLILGFSSGLPLVLCGATLQAWLSDPAFHIDIKTLGFLGLVTFPYTIKFLWAPLMDRIVPPFLGRRRGWILITQILVIAILVAISFVNPKEQMMLFASFAFLLAFFSASQDIAIDAYKADIFPNKDRALGAGMATNGYRIAMLVSGGGALILAQYFGWQAAYIVMAVLMGICILGPLLGPPPLVEVTPPRNLKECVVDPFIEFVSRPHKLFSCGAKQIEANTTVTGKFSKFYVSSIIVLLFIISYKLGDAFTVSFRSRYLLGEIGFSLAQVGSYIKIFGFVGTILGITWGGLLTAKIGYYRALMLFGVLQGLANLVYLILLWTGPNDFAGASAIFVDEFFGGMGSAAFGGLVMSLCNPKFTAFQMALLTSVSAIGRVFVSPVAGFIIAAEGWEVFYLSSLAVSAIGIVLLLVLKGVLEQMMDRITQLRESYLATPG